MPEFNPKPRPRAEGETDEAYNRRVGNWKMSQERLKSVGITSGVNKAKPGQIKAFEKKYGRTPSGYMPKPPVPPNPQPQPKPPTPKPDNKPDVERDREPRGGAAGVSAAGGPRAGSSGGGFGSNTYAAGAGTAHTPRAQAARAGLSQMPNRGRRARRRARQAQRRGGY